MIDLTPLEVRKKKGDFRRVMRGYDADLVDDFLDLAADRLEEVVRENLTLGERVHQLEEQVADFREREKALTEAVVSAQEFKEAQLNQVSREADLRIREAQTDAERIRDDALRERQREEEEIRRVRARRTQLIESFRAFLQREMHQLDVESAALDLQDVTAEAAARVWELGEETRRSPAPARVVPPAAGTRPAGARTGGGVPIGPRGGPAPRPPVPEPAAPEPAPFTAFSPERGADPPPFTAFSTQLTPDPAESANGAPVPRTPAADELPPITGNEEWLPLLEDER